MKRFDNKALLTLLAAVGLLGACSVGPNYVRPAVETPSSFKEMAGWKPAEPNDHAPRGRWWHAYEDPLLNSLEEQVGLSNQNLAQAEARYRQALALVDSARSAYYPSIVGGISTTRSRASSTTVAQPSAVPTSRGVVVNHNLPFSAAWEADVWGRISRTVEANAAGAQASAADLETARLSAQAALALAYFGLRTLDTQEQLLAKAIAGYGKSLQVSQNQYDAGVVSRADLVLAQTQLKTTQAQAIDIGVQRAQLEHAIALLVGRPPAGFSIERAVLRTEPPPVPIGVPSELLERRPDIAAAERRMAQANAQIGVAQAAYFPSLTLNAVAGFQSSRMAQWLTVPSRYWSVGPAVAELLFDGGLRRALTSQAVADYEANVATYRQTVLTAFQEAEDNLAALRILEEEARVQSQAVQFAQQSVALTTNQYQAGTVSYLNVVTVQSTALSNERTAVDILGRRLAASVLLIKALGGGWRAAETGS